jgi:molybdopterin-guanine dinucleotide biosynthesis protein A
MGSNKALLRLGADGPTLIETVVARLAQGDFPAPAIITNAPGEYTFLHLPTFPDDTPGNGALGGILTALRHSSHGNVLVVACDMPFLNPALLSYMASVPDEYDALVPVWSVASGKRYVEPLHAIYSKTAIPKIEHHMAAGELKLHKLLDALNTVYMPEKETRLYDPQLLSFRNVNTPEDWARLLSGDQPAAREGRAPARE